MKIVCREDFGPILGEGATISKQMFLHVSHTSNLIFPGEFCVQNSHRIVHILVYRDTSNINYGHLINVFNVWMSTTRKFSYNWRQWYLKRMWITIKGCHKSLCVKPPAPKCANWREISEYQWNYLRNNPLKTVLIFF